MLPHVATVKKTITFAEESIKQYTQMRTKELKPEQTRIVQSLNFVQAAEESGDSKEAIVANLTQGFKELELYKQGKIETTPAKDFLNEL